MKFLERLHIWSWVCNVWPNFQK